MVKSSLKIIILYLITSCSIIISPIVGNVKKDTAKAKKNLSTQAKQLIDQSFKGMNHCLVDTHVHAIGNGSGNTSNWVNPDLMSIMHPYKNIQFRVYMQASGIINTKNADQEYIQRLINLLKAEPRYGRVLLFAFDYAYNDDGMQDKKNSTFYVSNNYVYNLAKKYPQYFIPVVSIHPARKDAVGELKKWATKGVHFIKWLPNGQKIDPDNHKYEMFYKTVKQYDMVIIAHTGDEKAVDGEEFQKFGNPWRFKFPLDMGVKIIMSHVASLGKCKKLNSNEKQFCFRNFLEIINNPKYKDNVWGDISALTIYTHVGEATEVLLNSPQYASRLINGSDYPLPAINYIYRTSQFLKLGYINKKEKKLLNEIYLYNPLVFDFVLKRTIHHPKSGKKLLDQAFMFPKALCEKLKSIKEI